MTLRTRAAGKANAAATIYTNATQDVTGNEVRDSDTDLWDSAIIQEAVEDIASAATCAIGGTSSNFVRITGTTTITSFGTIAVGIVRFIRFAGILTLTHNATTLILPGAANITTAADDYALVKSDGSGNWRMFAYWRKSGKAVVASLATEVLLTATDYLTAITNIGVRFASPSIPDDTVWTFSPIVGGGQVAGMIVEFSSNAAANGYGSFYMRAATTPAIAAIAGTGLTALAAGTVPTGTTGVDGNVSVSCDASGNVYVENRKGSTISSFVVYIRR